MPEIWAYQIVLYRAGSTLLSDPSHATGGAQGRVNTEISRILERPEPYRKGALWVKQACEHSGSYYAVLAKYNSIQVELFLIRQGGNTDSHRNMISLVCLVSRWPRIFLGLVLT